MFFDGLLLLDRSLVSRTACPHKEIATLLLRLFSAPVFHHLTKMSRILMIPEGSNTSVVPLSARDDRNSNIQSPTLLACIVPHNQATSFLMIFARVMPAELSRVITARVGHPVKRAS